MFFCLFNTRRRPSVIRPAPIIIFGAISVSALFCRSPVFVCLGTLSGSETGRKIFLSLAKEEVLALRASEATSRASRPVPSPPVAVIRERCV